MTPMQLAEWTGAVTGIAGTFLLSTKRASKKGWRFTAFCLYLVSNVCMVTVGFASHVKGLVFMQAVFLVFTVNGLRNNKP